MKRLPRGVPISLSIILWRYPQVELVYLYLSDQQGWSCYDFPELFLSTLRRFYFVMFWCFEPWWRASFLRNYLSFRRDLMKRLMRRVPISVEYNFMKKSTGRIRLFISFRSTRVILLWFSGTLFINLTQVLLWCSDASSLDDEPWWRALMASLDDVQWWSVVLEEGRQEDRRITASRADLMKGQPWAKIISLILFSVFDFVLILWCM